MRILHSLVITPGLCGLYETAKEFIKAEEKLGHEVYVREPDDSSQNMKDSEIVKYSEGVDVDVIIDHSGCDKYLLGLGIPIIHIRHGRPLSSFLIENEGGIKIYSHLKNIGKDPRYVAVVTLWKEHVPFWENLMGRDIDYIPCPVDLDHYCPGGPKHNFGGKAHSGYNIVCADMWRHDECPFEALNLLLQRPNKNYKLHVYGIQTKLTTAQQALLSCFGDRLGEVGWSKDMAPIYRAADEVITGATINTRVVREALACGCKILGRLPPREYAMTHFDANISAKKLISIAERSLNGC